LKPLAINGKKIADIPSKWDELSPAQIRAVCQLSTSAMSEFDFKVKLFLITTGLTLEQREPQAIINCGEKEDIYFFFSRRTGRVLLSSWQLEFILREYDFLFSHHKNTSVIESRLVKNPWPVLNPKAAVPLYGPSAALFNITLAEFIRAETLYDQIISSPDGKTVDKFNAVLYRPRDEKADTSDPMFSGDIRQKFNDHLVDRNTSFTANLSLWQKIYIRLFYDGCRAFIIHKHPNAFSATGSDTQGEPKTVFEGFISLVTALSDNDATRAARLRDTLAWDVFPVLEALAIQEKKLKELKHKKPVY